MLCLGDRSSKVRFYENLNCEPEESPLTNLVNQCMCEKISSNPEVNAFMTKQMKAFNAVEDAGTVISYRCVECRGCKKCKEGELYENISISEEVQQHVVIKAVSVDLVENKCMSRLPFMQDPRVKLAPNSKQALKVYNRITKSLQNSQSDKEAVLKAFNKIISRGYASATTDLSVEQQERLKSSDIQNFIPWTVMYKETSISTPVRPVFNASLPTPSGYSLNDILAKGINGLNKLQEIVIRWGMHAFRFHYDVTSMYNNIKLDERDWCAQRLYFNPSLDPNVPPVEYIMTTNIYGVKSSGNIAEYAIRETARQSKDEYPDAYDAVANDTYVDDCLTGADSEEKAAR